VEETLRYDPPVQFTGRIATAPVQLGDLTIEQGDVAFLLLAAAGRDPAASADPDRFDIGRADIRHLAFGAGVHFCVGAPLARLEGEIALDVLARRLREPRLRTDPPTYRPAAVLRGPESLEIDLAGIAPAG
jgi:cytochrome P450